MKVPGNYPQWAMGGRSGKGSNLAAISPTAKHGRSHVSSRKLTAMGRWKSVPGKVQISMQSHSILWNMEEHMSVPGNFPQRGDGRTFRERFKSRCNLTPNCGIWENTGQFRETSRNGAMEKSSGKGSNPWIPHKLRYSSKFRNPQT